MPATFIEALIVPALDPSVSAGVAIVFGLLLVFLGRRLFWAFVGAMGFLAGLQLAPTVVPDQPQWVMLLVGVGLGLLGALLSIVLQRVAVAVAGWFGGGYLATRLAESMGWTDPSTTWIAFVVGAIIAAIVVSLLFDWAVIVLTTLSGASLVSDGLTLVATFEWGIAIALVIAGLVVQARSLARPASPPTTA